MIEKYLPKNEKPLRGYRLVFVLPSSLEQNQKYTQELLRLLLADWALGVNILEEVLGYVDTLLIPNRHLIPAIKSTAKIDDDFCELVTDGDGLNDQGEPDLSNFNLEEFEEKFLITCCDALKEHVKVDFNGRRAPLFTDWEVVLTRIHRKCEDEDKLEFKQDCKVLFTINEGLDCQKIAQAVLDDEGKIKPDCLIKDE